MVFNPLKIFHKTEEIKLKPLPQRNSNGKFISSKPVKKSPPIKTILLKKTSTVKPKIAKKAKVFGPYQINFYGCEVRKYYDGAKWYFSLEDILPLGQAEPALKPLAILKENKKFAQVYRQSAKVIAGIPCADAHGTISIALATKASFPGPFMRWIEETASFPFETTKDTFSQTKPVKPGIRGNPSDRI